jgi:hypothetical protein
MVSGYPPGIDGRVVIAGEVPRVRPLRTRSGDGPVAAALLDR